MGFPKGLSLMSQTGSSKKSLTACLTLLALWTTFGQQNTRASKPTGIAMNQNNPARRVRSNKPLPTRLSLKIHRI